MYKVIIVDDEIIFRKYFHTLIDWKSYDIEICGEAKNGIEALEMAAHIRPDIALIDINMPNMDGLTLSGKLKEKHDDIGIILVTGYNEFEYARKAIKIGVEDYIVKPFSENELIASLLKLKGKLQKQRDEKDAVKNNLLIIRERALNMLLEGGYTSSDEEIKKQLESLNIGLESNSFIVSTIEIDSIYQKWSNLNDIIEVKYTVSSIINNMIKVKGSHVAFNGPENRIISVVGFSDYREIEGFRPEIYQNIYEFIMKYFDFTVTVGIGPVVKSIGSIRDSYLKSLDAIRNKEYYETGKVLVYSEAKSAPENLRFYPSMVNEKLTMYLRLNDFHHIKEELDNIFSYCIRNKLSFEYNYAIIMGLKSVCLSYITEMDKNIEDVLGGDYCPMQIINNRLTIKAARDLIIDLFEKTVNYFSSSKPTKTKKVAEIVKTYIDLNYKDNELDLEKIAKSLFLNSDYIRRAFKKELNITLTDYITGVRMRKVKELIDYGNVKLSNLCYEVGISDASYFSKCFKKYYGLSPRDYENMKELDENRYS